MCRLDGQSMQHVKFHHFQPTPVSNDLYGLQLHPSLQKQQQTVSSMFLHRSIYPCHTHPPANDQSGIVRIRVGLMKCSLPSSSSTTCKPPSISEYKTPNWKMSKHDRPAERPYSHSAHARSQCATHLLTKTIISALSARKKTRGMQKGIQEGARPYRRREHSIYAPHCCNTVSAACCREPGPGDRDPAGAWGRCGDFSSWACSIERSRWGFRVDERRWVEIGTVVGKVLGEQDRCGRHGRLTLYAFEYGFKWPRSWVFHSPS